MVDEKYDSNEFVKVWNEYYVTTFCLSNNNDTNMLIHDRKIYFDDCL